jgi:hypothetical protein
MHAPVHHGDVLAGERPDDELAGVAWRGAAPKAGDVRIRDPRGLLDVLRETAQAAP